MRNHDSAPNFASKLSPTVRYRQTDSVAGASNGRHRATAPQQRRWGVVAAIVAAAVAIGLIVWATAFPNDQTTDLAAEPTATTSSPSAAAGPADLQATRLIDIKRQQLTVRETTRVVEGGPVTVAPMRQPRSAALTPLKIVLLGQDGSHRTFNDPVQLERGRQITVQSTYRLDHCPDLLPAQWPSATALRGDFSRTYTRIEEPQRTAAALCPNARPTNKQVKGLRGVATDAKSPTVRLAWDHQRKLTVWTVGSASGVATATRTIQCTKTCVAIVASASPTRVRLKPLEQCAVRGKTNRLTLRVSVGKQRPQIVALTVAGLAKKIC